MRDARALLGRWPLFGQKQASLENEDDLYYKSLSSLLSAGCLGRHAVEAYRARRLSEHQLAALLRMGRYDLDGILKRREVWLEYRLEKIQQELQAGERAWEKRNQEAAASGK